MSTELHTSMRVSSQEALLLLLLLLGLELWRVSKMISGSRRSTQHRLGFLHAIRAKPMGEAFRCSHVGWF